MQNTFSDLELIQTTDQSFTFYSPQFKDRYHSTHGAVTEALHIFIDAGLQKMPQNLQKIRILEIGFGSGLNAFLTGLAAEAAQLKIEYTGIEKYPLDPELAKSGYPRQFSEKQNVDFFNHLHDSEWETPQKISDAITLTKQSRCLVNDDITGTYDLIYFDAFSPSKQPDMWTESILKKVTSCLREGGLFVTYSAKSQVRRDLQSLGLDVKKYPGPPGKREFMTGHKIDGKVRSSHE